MITLVGCPLAAAISAISHKAGWFTIVFIAFGLAMGFAGSYCVRRLSYLILFTSAKVKTALLGLPLIIVYMVFPMLGAFNGFISRKERRR